MNRDLNYKFYEKNNKILMSVGGCEIAEIFKDDIKFKLPFIPERLKKQLTYSNIEILKAELMMIIEKWFETKACLDNWNLRPEKKS